MTDELQYSAATMKAHRGLRVRVRRRRWIPLFGGLYVCTTLCAIPLYAASGLPGHTNGEQLPAIPQVIVVAVLVSASIISFLLDNRR
jgi:hypothetical protein